MHRNKKPRRNVKDTAIRPKQLLHTSTPKKIPQGASGHECLMMATGIRTVNSLKVGEFADFLTDRVGQFVRVTEAKPVNQKLIFKVQSQEVGKALAAISPVLFKNDRVILTVVPPTQVNAAMSRNLSLLETSFQEYVKAAYNQRTKFLDISNIQSKILEKLIDFNEPQVLSTLFRVLSKQCPQLETISISNNNITSLRGWTLAGNLRDLKNFCFANNKIEDLAQLDHLKRLRVRELDFRDNPVSFLPNYKNDVERKFPQLRFLDGAEIKLLREFVLPTFITQGSEVIPSIPNFSDSEATRTTTTNFLKQYFYMFDANRGGLLDAYTDNSFFSLTFAGNSLRDPTILGNSRNLLYQQMNTLGQQATSLKHGRLQISQLISALPETKHELPDTTVDSYVLSSISSSLVLCIHTSGRLMLGDKPLLFIRTFLLVPNTTGFAQQQWAAVIINDHLHLQEFKGLLVLPPQPQPVQQPQVAVTLVTTPSEYSLEQQTLVIRLMQDSRLKQVHAVDCLTNASWNYDNAINLFRMLQASGKIPPEAFQ